MGLLDGKVAVITASGSGMGRASALKMTAEGAHVVVADIDEAAAAETVDMAVDAGGSASAHPVDVSDVAQIADLFAAVDRDHGRLDVLFAHAGIPGPPGIADVSEEDFDRTLDINLKSMFFSVARAIPVMEKAPSGSIIMTASVTGVVGSPFAPLYSLTKGGVVVFAKSAALHLAPKIRVNVICPGPVDTPMLPRFFGREPGADVSDLMQGFLDASVPLRRPAQPTEIGDVVLFLASDMSSFVTGVTMPVDGGFLAR
jgi:NAD(P)-dependent dehydrogenase (short-subunit alcohol dehydrogenase family)